MWLGGRSAEVTITGAIVDRSRRRSNALCTCTSEIGGFMPVKRFLVAVVAAASLMTLAACDSSGTHTQSLNPSAPSSQPGRSSSSSDSPSPSQSDPRPAEGKAATAAYTAFAMASRNAERRPTDLGRRKALAAHAIEPALTNEAASLVSYAANDIAWSGTAPSPRVRVVSVDPAAKPYPSVTLRDCPTAAPTWKPYNIKTHEVVPVKYPGSTAPPPHAVTATVVYFKSHWMVQRTVTEVKKTCAP